MYKIHKRHRILSYLYRQLSTLHWYERLAATRTDQTTDQLGLKSLNSAHMIFISWHLETGLHMDINATSATRQMLWYNLPDYVALVAEDQRFTGESIDESCAATQTDRCFTVTTWMCKSRIQRESHLCFYLKPFLQLWVQLIFTHSCFTSINWLRAVPINLCSKPENSTHRAFSSRESLTLEWCQTHTIRNIWTVWKFPNWIAIDQSSILCGQWNGWWRGDVGRVEGAHDDGWEIPHIHRNPGGVLALHGLLWTVQGTQGETGHNLSFESRHGNKSLNICAFCSFYIGIIIM